MKFGLHYLMSVSESQSPSQRYWDTLEQAVRAEELGFESVWPVEQHFNQIQSALPCPTAHTLRRIRCPPVREQGPHG
jgi:alkanesulfonate monooxygenase SsuD/methylene tetrahydromethanopterin reductase-like flavin-dependent oxidoreductase (luciferase family)